MTTAHALQTPSTPRNFCSMDAAPILATMPKPAPAKPQAPQQARVLDLFGEDEPLGQAYGSNPRRPTAAVRRYRTRANVSVSAWLRTAHTSHAAGHDKKTASAWSCSGFGTNRPAIECQGGNGSGECRRRAYPGGP